MELETHPFEPWLPSNAKLLLLGTFPPPPKWWCVEWYYPNFSNDMWRIFGHIFFHDKLHFVDERNKTYRLGLLKPFLKEKGVAIFDTALKIHRPTGTASDKDLEIVETSDLDGILRALPNCKAVVGAGQLASRLITSHFHIDTRHLKMGEYVGFEFSGRNIRLYRQPSSSRAFPMKVEKKAEYYQQMFEEIDLK
ncbi:uracil-DNA glycosylase family protein [Prevotella brunnea]|uniref:Uracil-DNA glycosylase family protein n=1 Tax=Prevotella brunnea TaxID=2508867 RepID=A0A5C8GJZ5_9BACT|nr:uracil-DNA glycosylase family protein [Prevotella brunnea]MDR0186544.1 uracil-DNA glycosylase family protein [Prevotella brunnea]TXJ62185.1 uracil-DNA glycosylase family protein [Prevotella brunnea]